MRRVDYIILLGFVFIISGAICLSGINEFNTTIVGWIGLIELAIGTIISIIGIIKKQ